MAWKNLEHALYQNLSKLPLGGRKLVVAFSGGLDSVALMASLESLKNALKIQVIAAHVHHGGASEYRDKALKFCDQWCSERGVAFLSQRAPEGVALESEEQFRDFRYQVLTEMKNKLNADLIVTAHHQNDLLETRFLRLLRGTGLKGLQAMQILDGDRLKPLLMKTKNELSEYASQCDLKWIEDPSNQDLGPLRNWLRNQWLPELEAKAPGASAAFARSLELILQQAVTDPIPDDLWSDRVEKRALRRPVFLTMTEKQQKAALAQYLVSLGQEQFTQNHILEVMKHLDKTDNEHMFKVAQCEWRISAQQILAYPI